ncbi:unnamed protein product [Lactuca saligna]|uniref:Uncharacterized protein n=1 Tax=Lactuca saligna TaxID=75948 RepID=A0AA35YE38_LACSI|nr:unnamed protein product [Lactuca saligna]
MSPTKVVIEQLDDEPSLELNRIRPKKKETGSCPEEAPIMQDVRVDFNGLDERDILDDFELFTDNGYQNVDPQARVDDWDVDIREYINDVDGVEWFRQAPQTQANLNQHGDVLEVINKNEFESACYVEEDVKKIEEGVLLIWSSTC